MSSASVDCQTVFDLSTRVHASNFLAKAFLGLTAGGSVIHFEPRDISRRGTWYFQQETLLLFPLPLFSRDRAVERQRRTLDDVSLKLSSKLSNVFLRVSKSLNPLREMTEDPALRSQLRSITSLRETESRTQPSDRSLAAYYTILKLVNSRKFGTKTSKSEHVQRRRLCRWIVFYRRKKSSLPKVFARG